MRTTKRCINHLVAAFEEIERKYFNCEIQLDLHKRIDSETKTWRVCVGGSAYLNKFVVFSFNHQKKQISIRKIGFAEIDSTPPHKIRVLKLTTI